MSPLSYSPMVQVQGHEYFPPPYSLEILPPVLRHGLVVVGLLATLSVGATLSLICFILWRLFSWKRHYRTFLGHNQYVILVLNLLLADLQQSAAYLVSFHWVRKNRILAPTVPCFAQGWLLHSGDVSSGFFVLAIAIHTYFTAVHGRRVDHKTFAVLIVCVWLFAYLLTALGVGLHGSKYFVRAGAWCWVSEAYESDRLALHYCWVFLVQFGTILIYIVTFLNLKHKTSRLFDGVPGHGPNATTVKAVNRITKLMTLYPCVYIILTLPLSAGRMWSMAHHGRSYSDQYALVAGAFLTSCGWIDSLLYTLTRKRLLKDTMPGSSSSITNDLSRRITSSATTDTDPSFVRDSLRADKGTITHTRTVTIQDELVLSPVVPSAMSMTHTRPPSCTGPLSIDDAGGTRPGSSGESVASILGKRWWRRGSRQDLNAGLEELYGAADGREDPRGWSASWPASEP